MGFCRMVVSLFIHFLASSVSCYQPPSTTKTDAIAAETLVSLTRYFAQKGPGYASCIIKNTPRGVSGKFRPLCLLHATGGGRKPCVPANGNTIIGDLFRGPKG